MCMKNTDFAYLFNPMDRVLPWKDNPNAFFIHYISWKSSVGPLQLFLLHHLSLKRNKVDWLYEWRTVCSSKRTFTEVERTRVNDIAIKQALLLPTAREGNVFRGVCLFTRGRKTPLEADPLVLTSSGGHCSGRYVFYWNAFLNVTEPPGALLFNSDQRSHWNNHYNCCFLPQMLISVKYPMQLVGHHIWQ